MILSYRKFDLIVITALGNYEINRIVNVCGGAKVLICDQSTPSSDFLSMVAERLGEHAASRRVIVSVNER
jgi:hypothetical protein